MKIKIKKIESIIKILILSCFLFAPSISLADLSTEKWEKVCDSANNNCVIAIQIQIKLPNSDVLETFSTALVRVGKNPKNEKVPVLFIRLPLNTDLKTKPKADAIYTQVPNIVCGIYTADCLPVFFSDKNGCESALSYITGAILSISRLQLLL